MDMFFYAGILPSTFLRPANGSKNSILNLVMKLNLFIFFLEASLENFPFYSILLTLWVRYSQTCIKGISIYLTSQESKNSKIPRKIHFLAICRSKFQKMFSSMCTMRPPHEATELTK